MGNPRGKPPIKKIPRKYIQIEYNPDIHDPILFEFGRNGKSYTHFCLEIGINWEQYHEWCKLHPGFQEAHEMFKMLCHTYYEQLGVENLDNPNFNWPMYKIIAKWAGADPDGIRLSGLRRLKTPLKKIQHLQNAMGTGNINSKDSNAIIHAIVAEVEIMERTKLADEVEELKRLNDIK